LRRFGATIGEGVTIHSPLIIHCAFPDYSKLSIGKETYVGRSVLFDLKERIEIGERATVAMRCAFITHTNAGPSRVSKTLPVSAAPIRINDDAYLGANTTVLQGVSIGEQAVVGAGSVVLHDVPSFTLAAGNPCRAIRNI